MRTCPDCGSTKTYPAASNFMCENHHMFSWTAEQNMSCEHYDMGRALAGSSDWMAKKLRSAEDRKNISGTDNEREAAMLNFHLILCAFGWHSWHMERDMDWCSRRVWRFCHHCRVEKQTGRWVEDVWGQHGFFLRTDKPK